ncbi:MAG TPA: hypothetical protein PL168_00760 [Methanobacterium sp.]|jgi:hypothetical protein|nr:hypothetical protein [Methanobacterium sp.]HOI39238.1 hypothetical protein [Methanobacterium sp.]
MTYLVCEKCWSYYELQEGESIDDFDSCECGGKLAFTDDYEIIKQVKKAILEKKIKKAAFDRKVEGVTRFEKDALKNRRKRRARRRTHDDYDDIVDVIDILGGLF